jgi:hypothetical protein
MNPAGWPKSFHDDEVDGLFSKDRFQVIPVGGREQKRVFPGFGGEKAAHRIELIEIESENLHSVFNPRFW